MSHKNSSRPEADGIAESARQIERTYWQHLLGREYSAFGFPLPAYALSEVSIMPGYSEIHPNDVSLSGTLGGIPLRVPFLSAPMDTVTGDELAVALSTFGGAGIIYRTRKPEEQLDWVRAALRRRPCLVEDPVSLPPSATVSDAEGVLKQYGFSTIPVIGDGRFLGLLFTRDVGFKWHKDEPVSKWMKEVGSLKTVDIGTPFREVRNRLRTEQECSVLPAVDGDRLVGLYFMKDCVYADPSLLPDGRPVVGMAINDNEADIGRACAGIEAGVSMVVIDSSHGNGLSVIGQVGRLREAVGGRKVAIIAGNVADIDGYLRLSAAGADVVKLGIGPGSICTTSEGTGVGYPMWTLIHKIAFARVQSLARGIPAADIVADGSINSPGDVVKALGAGADAVMGGKMFVAADESVAARTPKEGWTKKEGGKAYVLYRGMASQGAMDDRNAGRYGEGKQAPEGVAGYVERRGPLRKWFPKTLELVRGGLGHTGSPDLASFREYCTTVPGAWVLLSSAGQAQNAPRVS